MSAQYEKQWAEIVNNYDEPGVDPSSAGIGGIRRVLSGMRNRLYQPDFQQEMQMIKETAANGVLPFSVLHPGLNLEFFLARPGYAFNDNPDRILELQLTRGLGHAISARVISDTYNHLQRIDGDYGYALPAGADITLLGSWNCNREEPTNGHLIRGLRLDYTWRNTARNTFTCPIAEVVVRQNDKLSFEAFDTNLYIPSIEPSIWE